MPLKILDEYNIHSIPYWFRWRRFQYFIRLLHSVHKPLHILDVGGTQEFWESMGFSDEDVHITLYNLSATPATHLNFTSVTGDATDLSRYRNKEFDIVFSNSVIEHLFTWENQQKMAGEIRRVGKRFYVQTPNYFFPIEPHWMFPLFQFLPKAIRITLTQHFTLGHREKAGTKARAIKSVEEVKLLTCDKMKRLFPEAMMRREVFAGFTKSIVVYYFP